MITIFCRSARVEWFEFTTPRWHHIGRNSEGFNNILNGEFSKKIEAAIEELESEEGPYKNLIEIARFILNKHSRRTDFKDFVIKEPKANNSIVKISKKWLSALNDNKNIIGFEDVVYDFGDHTAMPRVIPCFRPGTPADVVTMSVGFTRAEGEERDKNIQAEIVAALKDMHVDGEVYDFIT